MFDPAADEQKAAFHRYLHSCSNDAQGDRKSRAASHLSDHPVPDAPDQLAVLAVGDQVEVVGELYGAGQLLQDVDAEAFAAQLGVGLGVTHNAEGQRGTGDVIGFVPPDRSVLQMMLLKSHSTLSTQGTLQMITADTLFVLFGTSVIGNI